jgi:hypothetical protein
VYRNFITFASLIFNSLFCLLMIILSIFAWRNISHIRIIPRQRRNQPRSMTKKDFQLLRCLFTQDVIYISVSLFLTLHSAYVVIRQNQVETPLEQAINDFLTKFFTFLYYTFYCSSFFIFFCISKAFRLELQRIIYKMFKKDLIPTRERPDDNVQLNVVVSTVLLPV